MIRSTVVRQARKALIHEQRKRASLPCLAHARMYSSGSEDDEEDRNQQISHISSRWGGTGALLGSSFNSTLSWTKRSACGNLRIMKVHSPAALSLLSTSNHQVLWFSTTNKEVGLAAADATRSADEKEKKSYRERAADYRDQAKDGAKTFGGMMKAYGPVFVGTYLSLYGVVLGSLYLGVESGVMDPVTTLGYLTGNHEEARSSAVVVGELLEHYTITEPFAETVKQRPGLANFAIAWVSTKFTEPLRLGVTAMILPRVARYFGRTVPSSDAAPAEATATTGDSQSKDDPKK